MLIIDALGFDSNGEGQGLKIVRLKEIQNSETLQRKWNPFMARFWTDIWIWKCSDRCRKNFWLFTNTGAENTVFNVC